jgi:hypothetical protein
MQALVSDQSASFGSVVIGTAPNATVVASLELPPGSWVVFATVAFASSGAVGKTVVQLRLQLDGTAFGQEVQSNFFAEVADSSVAGFLVVPLTTGLVLDTPKTLQIACVAGHTGLVTSQPTTITAIRVESVTVIR